MDSEAIVAHLNEPKGLPKEALCVAAALRTLLVPRFIQIMEDHLALPPSERPQKTPLFSIFHLLNESRCASCFMTDKESTEPVSIRECAISCPGSHAGSCRATTCASHQ